MCSWRADKPLTTTVTGAWLYTARPTIQLFELMTQERGRFLVFTSHNQTTTARGSENGHPSFLETPGLVALFNTNSL